MSVQDRIEAAPGRIPDEEPGTGEQTTASMVVKRWAAFPALIGIGALLLATSYTWRAVHDGGAMLWLVATALGLIAAGHLALLADARTPLLVADHTGVRVRSGRRWRGLPWSRIDAVDVMPQSRRWREGRIVIRPADTSAETVSVPLGWMTRASTDDVAAAVQALAQGRTEVTAPLQETAVPPETEETPEPDETSETEPDGAPTGEPDSAPQAQPDSDPEPAVDPGPTASKPRRPALAVLRAIRPGLRAEVTKPAATDRLTVGTLALSEPLDEPAADLPEIAHLRRSGPGNVSLLVAAPEPEESPEPASEQTVAPNQLSTREQQAEPVIGPQLAAARERLGMIVDDVALRTRIRPHVIEAIEVDEFAPCGGDFYARGHLRALARVLGVDPEPLVREYDGRYATAPINPRTVFEADRATGARGTIRIASGGPNWTALIAVVLVLLLVWGVARLFTGGSSSPAEHPLISGLAALLLPGSA